MLLHRIKYSYWGLESIASFLHGGADRRWVLWMDQSELRGNEACPAVQGLEIVLEP